MAPSSDFPNLVPSLLRRRGNVKFVGCPFNAKNSVDKVSPSSDVALLIAATNLNRDSSLMKEMDKVIALEELVGELSVAHALLGFKPLADIFLGHHGAHPRIPPNILEEIQQAKVFPPLIIIQDRNRIRGRSRPAKNVVNGGGNPRNVLIEGFKVELRPFGTLARRVTYTTNSSLNKGDSMMTATEELRKDNNAEEIAEVEAVQRWGRNHSRLEEVVGLGWRKKRRT